MMVQPNVPLVDWFTWGLLLLLTTPVQRQQQRDSNWELIAEAEAKRIVTNNRHE